MARLRKTILNNGLLTTGYYLAVGPWLKAKAWFDKEGFPEIRDYTEANAAMCCKHETRNAIALWFDEGTELLPKPTLMNYIAHESCHASWKTEQLVGDIFDSDIQEPQCYLIGWLTEEIYKFITKKTPDSPKKTRGTSKRTK